uniref:Uncharacterized protein n=1 Tax=Caenorhabditis japonica TaxID=281687 RepID=A0A8R1EB04_CAEJA
MRSPSVLELWNRIGCAEEKSMRRDTHKYKMRTTVVDWLKISTKRNTKILLNLMILKDHEKGVALKLNCSKENTYKRELRPKQKNTKLEPTE